MSTFVGALGDIVKKKHLNNMSNSMILAAIFKICKLGQLDVISHLANIDFLIQHTKLPLIMVSNHFLHKCMYLLTFLNCFTDYMKYHNHTLQTKVIHNKTKTNTELPPSMGSTLNNKSTTTEPPP